MKRTKIYNRVMAETGICPAGELLTDKELEKMKQSNRRRDWPNTTRVRVRTDSIYTCFGARFAAFWSYLSDIDNALPFVAHGTYFNGAEVIEIQISRAREAARYRSTTRYCIRDEEVEQGRWQEIKQSEAGPYIMKRGKRLKLSKFQCY